MTIDFEGWLAVRKAELKKQEDDLVSNDLTLYLTGKLDLLNEIECLFAFAREEEQSKSGIGNDAAERESENRD